MDDCNDKQKNDRCSPKYFVEPANAEIVLTQWKIPEKKCPSEILSRASRPGSRAAIFFARFSFASRTTD